MPRSGYPSSGRQAEDLASPPKGPAPGGRIVHESPERIAHRCDQPEIWVADTDESAPFGRRYRKLHHCGTVWECSCGRTWVVTGPGAELIDEWEPEGRFARWRRQRRQRRERDRARRAQAEAARWGGCVVFEDVEPVEPVSLEEVLPPSAAIATRGQQQPHRTTRLTTSRKPPPPPPRGSR